MGSSAVRRASGCFTQRLVPGLITVSPTAPVSATAVTAPVAAAGTLLTLSGDVDVESAAAQFFAIQGVDGFLSLFGRVHGYESEAAWAARGSVIDDDGFDNRAMGGEGVLEVIFRDFEVEVSDE
jgi:hypothetical protein